MSSLSDPRRKVQLSHIIQLVKKAAKLATTYNGVVLPDGKVFIVGGQTQPVVFTDLNAVMTPEIWDPATATTIDVAQMVTPRDYHSTALLLPDGRVFSGGGGQCGEGCPGNHFDFEFYSPPYLFDADGSPATRPVISAAPSTLVLNQELTVSVNEPVTSFVLIRMAATTHTIDTDQRRIPLGIGGINADGSWSLQVPSDPGITVPGYYMLFALDANNVPSVAKIILVEASS